MCGTGGLATGVREVATVEELTAALNDAALHYVRITQDLVLVQEIVFARSTPLVVEGACGGGTRGCTVSPASPHGDYWGDYSSDYNSDYSSDSNSDSSVQGEVAQIRLFDVTLSLPADEELSFIGLTFTGGNAGTGVRPPIDRCGAPGPRTVLCAAPSETGFLCSVDETLTSRASVCRTAVR